MPRTGEPARGRAETATTASRLEAGSGRPTRVWIQQATRREGAPVRPKDHGMVGAGVATVELQAGRHPLLAAEHRVPKVERGLRGHPGDQHDRRDVRGRAHR
jgi:hypothetical protein